MSVSIDERVPLFVGLASAGWVAFCAPAVAQENAQGDIDVAEIRAQIDSLHSEQARIAEAQERTDAALRALEARLEGATSAQRAADVTQPANGAAGANVAGQAPGAGIGHRPFVSATAAAGAQQPFASVPA